MNKFNVGDVVKNKSGENIEIIKTDLKSKYPIVGIVLLSNTEEIRTYDKDGVFFKDSNSENNLVPNKVYKYINVWICYDGDDDYIQCSWFDSKEVAKTAKDTIYIYLMVAHKVEMP